MFTEFSHVGFVYGRFSPVGESNPLDLAFSFPNSLGRSPAIAGSGATGLGFRLGREYATKSLRPLTQKTGAGGMGHATPEYRGVMPHALIPAASKLSRHRGDGVSAAPSRGLLGAQLKPTSVSMDAERHPSLAHQPPFAPQPPVRGRREADGREKDQEFFPRGGTPRQNHPAVPAGLVGPTEETLSPLLGIPRAWGPPAPPLGIRTPRVPSPPRKIGLGPNLAP